MKAHLTNKIVKPVKGKLVTEHYKKRDRICKNCPKYKLGCENKCDRFEHTKVK